MINFDKKHPSVRAKAIRSMEYLVRSINNEDIMYSWLLCGVADGDINGQETDEDLEDYYADDETFAEIMGLFLKLMNKASKDGGLYVDGVVSKETTR